jgi:hypothetical protein
VNGQVEGGEAQRLVECAYGILDLFTSEAEMVRWAKDLDPARPDKMVPVHFAAKTGALLTGHLQRAAVVHDDGTVDDYRLRDFQQVVALLPYFRLAEEARRPTPRPKVVFTVPDNVKLPAEAATLQRSLAKWVFDALISATDRTLLASPFWSAKGTEKLWPYLQRSVGLDIPITLAGARRRDPDEGGNDDLGAMLDLGRRLRDAGATVRALRFEPPGPYSIFHAKLVCGAEGYLGSANLTGAGLGEHVEAGLPLDATDVDQVWWLLGLMEKAGVLIPAAL